MYVPAHLVSASESRDIVVWHNDSKGRWGAQRTVRGLGYICTCVCPCAGSVAVTGFEDGTLRLLDVRDESVPLQVLAAACSARAQPASRRGGGVVVAVVGSPA